MSERQRWQRLAIERVLRPAGRRSVRSVPSIEVTVDQLDQPKPRHVHRHCQRVGDPAVVELRVLHLHLECVRWRRRPAVFGEDVLARAHKVVLVAVKRGVVRVAPGGADLLWGGGPAGRVILVAWRAAGLIKKGRRMFGNGHWSVSDGASSGVLW